MGLGDDIMATAQARVVHEATGHKVTFGYWSEVFDNNPIIARDGPAIGIDNRPGRRPYILGVLDRRFVFNPNFRAVPGEIWLTEAERRGAFNARIIVEPHVKEKVSGRNKAWPWEKWQELVGSLEDVYQLDYGKPLLEGVAPLRVGSFREACAHLEGATLICTDGGLHHAAAALGARAIVLWGHYSSPENLGYDDHVNIWGGSGPCGNLDPCEQCEEAMNAITVDEVLEHLS